jgi:hypothetical protein
MIREVLRSSNRELFDDATCLLGLMQDGEAAPELDAYRGWLAATLEDVRRDAQEHLDLLSQNYPELTGNILSKTQDLTRTMTLCSSRLAGPLLRFRARDRLSLRVLSWLHATHALTVGIPFAVSDGAFASWPWPPYPTVYFIPATGLGSLRYQPLFFHEFGHLLYALHKGPLDRVVGRFQREIMQLLEPRLLRNDARSQTEAQERLVIVETWYRWTQEFFCDTVGLRIGGPGFLCSFSHHLRLRGGGDFASAPHELPYSSHPPPSLRVRALEHMASEHSLGSEGNRVRLEWDTIADTMGIQRDYFGFYAEVFFEPLVQTIEGMIDIAQPYRFTPEDLALKTETTVGITPVGLANAAWRVFHESTENYREWETQSVERFLRQEAI